MSTNTHHSDCDLGDELPPDYFSPGYSIMHGKPAFSTWAEIPHDGAYLRFERTDLGAPWVRVERWIEWHGMPWNTGGLYRFRGKRLCGWPDEVQFYCEETGQWEDCPNVNAHMRIARTHIHP